MNLLSQIIERLNQRINVGNIFDQFYGLSEYFKEQNAYTYYIGDGQAIPVTNYDAKQGTIFWAKRGKTTMTKQDNLRLAGCKSVYETRFQLTAYCMVRKSHLPCDSAESQDWVATRVLRLISGQDAQFRQSIGVVGYEVLPSGYQIDNKVLPPNYEWAAVAVEIDIIVSNFSEDGCYDACNVGDIPLPDFQPCTPCLTEVAVDGVTITGNGTAEDPLVAIGGGGGSRLLVALPFTTDHTSAYGNQYVVGNVVWYNGNVYRCIANNDSILPTNTSYWINLGAGFALVQQPIDWNSTSGNNQILNKPTIPPAQVNSDWNAVSGVAEILNKPTIPVLPSTIVESVTATSPLSSSGGANPDISLPQASSSQDGYLSSADWSTFDGKQDTMIAGTDISIVGTTINNTAPDQIVSITGGTGISVSGTYPSFTIGNTAPVGMQGGTASGTDTYSVSIAGVTAYNVNDAYAIGFTNANTGASTLNINGLGAVPISKNNVVPIIGGDIAAGQRFIAIYDGTNFQLLGIAPNQMFAFVTNADSVTINKGQVVYAFGASGDRMSVKLANNTSDATSAKTIGLVFSSSIAPNGTGYIITQGVINGLNLGAYNAGDTLYLGATAGSYTSTKPYAPNHMVYVGIVERANAGNGQIYVRVQNGYELNEIHDVDLITTPPVNNDLLVYTTGANNLWKNKSLGTLLGGTTSQYVRGDGSLATLPSATSTPYIEGELIGNAISQNSNCLDILVEPSINRLYVPFFGGNVTYIFNTSTNALVATLSTTGVNAVFYIASVNQLWVTYLANGNISRFNASTGASAGADITGSGNRGQHYIEYSATKVFIANSGSNSVTVVNPATATVTATIATTAAFPRSMVLNTNVASAQNDRIAVVCANGNAMLLINPNTNAITIAAVNVGSQMSTPNSIVYDATSDRYIIGNIGNNRLLYITPTTATTFTYDTYTDAFRPYELNYDSSTRYIYIAQPTPANAVFNPTSLAIVNAATKQMIKQIVTSSFDATNIGLAVITIDTTNGYIYLVSYGSSARIIKIKI
jgi:YVTN family beta-propeller protein